MLASSPALVVGKRLSAQGEIWPFTILPLAILYGVKHTNGRSEGESYTVQ